MNRGLKLAICLLAAAAPPACTTAPAAPAPVAAADAAEIKREVLAALKERRYADAMAATRRAPVGAAERDFALGMLALEGLADADAKQRPAESVAGALALVESAALAGHSQAVSTLASTFERGLRDGAGDALLVAPDAALSACWRGAAEQPADARRCAAMRSGRR